MNQQQKRHYTPPVLTEYQLVEKAEAAKGRLEELRASQEISRMCMGVIVESSQEGPGVRVKFLALPGYCGPELVIDRGLVGTLHELLGKYLATGETGVEMRPSLLHRVVGRLWVIWWSFRVAVGILYRAIFNK
jgi:hypothetical protein